MGPASVLDPAHLRQQWQAELSSKFDLSAVVVDRSIWNAMLADGVPNPFDCGRIPVTSYTFAARMQRTSRKTSLSFVLPDDLPVGYFAFRRLVVDAPTGTA